MQYHLEAYVHKMHTVLEVMRLMVNEVYAFGIQEKECTWDNLRKYPGMKNSAVSKVLNYYFKTFKNVNDIRHVNTHRGIFSDKDMDELSSHVLIYSSAKKYQMDISKYEDIYPEFLLKYNLKKVRKSRINDINLRNRAVYIY